MLTAEQSFRLRKAEHLRSNADFRRVYDRRVSASDELLLVYASENSLAFSRFGISVGRRVGKAVFRNRLRRLYREAFRLSRAQLPVSLDFVMIPRSSREPSLAELMTVLPKLAHVVARKLVKKESES